MDENNNQILKARAGFVDGHKVALIAEQVNENALICRVKQTVSGNYQLQEPIRQVKKNSVRWIEAMIKIIIRTPDV